VDEVCSRFEAAWRAGTVRRIEEYLAGWEGTGLAVLLAELIALEVYYRRLQSEACTPEEYQARFPDFPLARLSEPAALLGGQTAAVPTQGGLAAATHAPGTDQPAEVPLPRTEWVAVPGYEVLGLLGQGGMGVVYKARQLDLQRVVAIKMILHSEHAGPGERERLRTDAQTLARLQHPNIVQVFEVGECRGLPYFSMEFCPGGSLEAKLDGMPWEAKRAARLVQTLSGAVQAAHQAQVIHRDLKPANVLLAADGTPKVADFGLAKKLDEQGQTPSGAVLGTPSYMAPEQAGGKGRGVGPATDVYALGAILYELLTGRPPFKAATALDTVLQVVSEEPVAVRRLQPKVPRDLETVCHKCLEKAPAGRYPSAAALAEDLGRFIRGEPVAARPVGPLARLGRWGRRNPALASLTAAVALLVVGVTAVSLAAAWRMNRIAERALKAEQEATGRLFDTLVTRAEAGRGSGRPGQRFGSLQALRESVRIARQQGRPAADLVPLRNTAIACLALPDLRREQEWEGNPPGTNGLCFDAPFRRYAWSFKDEGISVRRLEDHRELCRLRTPPSEVVSRWASMSFSPDGRYLTAWYSIWGGLRRLEIWELSPGASKPRIAVEDATCPPEFTTDGAGVLVGLPGGPIARMELASGKEVGPRLAPGWVPQRLALHPGGRLLAVASQPGVQIRELPGGRVVWKLPHPQGVQGLAWHPDGDLLAAGCNDQCIHLWDARSGKKGAVLEGHTWEVHDLTFEPTGRWLASFGWDMTLRVWDVEARRQVLNREDIRVVSFRRDGPLAAAGLVGRQIQVWSLVPSRVFDTLGRWSHRDNMITFSPDSRWLAATTESEDTASLFDLGARRLVRKSPELTGAVWSPDGTSLVSHTRGRLMSWPVRQIGPGTAGIRIGPARPIRGEMFRLHYWGPGNRLLSFDGKSRIRLSALGDEVRTIWEDTLPNISTVFFSFDGRWVAGGSNEGGGGVRIWGAATGRLATKLPIGDAEACFSGDSRWLFTTTGRTSPRGGGAGHGAWVSGSRLTPSRFCACPRLQAH
jgi:WD40 repeat protein